MRPFVEGHMGRLNGRTAPTGDIKAPSWPDDPNHPTGKKGLEPGRRRAMARAPASIRRPTPSSSVRATRHPGTAGSAPATVASRTTHDSLYTSGQVGVDPSTGEVEVLPAHPERCLGLLRQQRAGAVRLQGQGRQDRQGHRPCRPQRLLLCGGPQGRQAAERLPFVDGITWASHIDLKTGRPVENEGQRPPKPEPGEKHGKSVEVSPPFLGGKNWNPMAHSRTPACSTCRPTTGRRTTGPRKSATRRAPPTGQGFRIKRMYDDHVGILRAMNPATGKVEWEHGCRCGPACWQPRALGLHRHQRRLHQGLQRQNR